MKTGFQSKGLSYWEHGELVAARFRDLMQDSPAMTWRLPPWFTQSQDLIRAALRPRSEVLMRYQLWHDCGKPATRQVDADGRVHYPDHAEASSRIWLQLGGEPEIAELIRRDMECHLLRPAGAAAFAKTPFALELLITSLCELHANATMFGGMDSESFKIKFKRLDRCGSIILKELGYE